MTDTSDVYGSLRMPDEPVQPREQFATSLRNQIAAELGLLPTISTPERTSTMSNDTATQESGQNTTTVVPYLCAHDAAGALDWYALAFGAVETTRWTDDQGRVGHAELVIGGATFYLSDEHPEIGVLSARTLGGSPIALHLRMKDVDYSYRRAVEYGATGLRPPEDQPYGDRSATIVDPYGLRWMLNQPISTLSPAQLQENNPTYAISTQRVTELGYLTMPTSDVDVASSFYSALFGWHLEPNGHISNTRLPMGFDRSSTEVRVWFRVEDLEPYLEKIRALGGEVVDVHEYESGGGAECRDDQGFRFDLHRPAPGY